MSNPWFRLHSEILSDEKIMSLGFSDRWFFVGVMCLKCEGMIEKYEGKKLDRKVALKLGMSLSEAEELKERLADEGLIDETWEPCAWDKRQYKSDTSKDRVARHRAKQKQQDSDVKRSCNVTVTPPDTDTDTDTEVKIIRAVCAVPGQFNELDFEKFWVAFPSGRKRGKGDCRSRFKKLIEKTGIDPDVIIDAVRNGNGIDPAFPPMPATWLNQGRWEDDPQQSSSKPTAHQNNMNNLREILADDERAARETENHSNPAGLLADGR